MKFMRTIKEVVRHLLYRTGLRIKASHVTAGDRRERFEDIYKKGVWSYGRDDVPSSGEGSSLAATEALRAQLPGLLRALDAKLLLDVGCGDFTWISQIDLPCDYIGADIVPSLIEVNAARYASPSRTFLVADAVTQALPNANVVLCREVLFHLSFSDAKAALRNILNTGCSHLLVTSDSDTLFNADIESGDFRLLNLRRRPFGFPIPVRTVDDSAVSKGRFIGVWEAAAIRIG